MLRSFVLRSGNRGRLSPIAYIFGLDVRNILNSNECDKFIFSTTARMRSIFTSKLQNSKLIVNPESCLQDEIISIKAINLDPGTKITLTSSTKDTRGHDFFCYAHYISNDTGVVDLSVDKSLGGSYNGIFPMGPIACLQPGPHENIYLRYLKRDLDVPNLIEIKLLLGHLAHEDAFKPESSLILDSFTHKRIFMTPEVKRIPITEGKLRGCLYLPAGEGPFPGVIDVFGTAGGLIEHRSAQLASRGIASLALAYFAYKDLPKDLEFLDIDYFAEGAKLLMSNSKVKKSGIGAIGNSKGGDLACSMGAFIPEVKAVVCINGLPVNTWCDLKVKDKIYPGLKFDFSRIKPINPQLISSQDMMDRSEDFPDTYLPLHKSNAYFLFLVSLDDQNWHTDWETDKAVQRMKENGYNKYEVMKFKGAGHLLEPPYSPYCYASFHKIAQTGLIWGGNNFEHSLAQEESWKAVIKFIKTNL